MIAIRLQEVSGKILVQFFNDSFQHSQPFTGFGLLGYQLVRLYPLGALLLNSFQQLAALHFVCDTPHPFQHLTIQILVINCVVVLAIFWIGIVVSTTNQRCRPGFQRLHHQRHTVSALRAKGQVFEHIVKVMLFRPVP